MEDVMDATPDMIRVIVADDHPIVREGLRMMIEIAEGITLVGEAADGASAIQLVGQMQPDVVLMDLRMPGGDGLDAIAQIRARWPRVAVLILTTYNEDDLMIRGLQAGAKGYLLKDSDISTLIDAIRTVARGDALHQPEIMERILAHAARGVAAAGVTATHPDEPLTEREQEILAAVVRGEHTKEIARHLQIAERTVRAHLTSIYLKLGVDSRAAAVAAALGRGLLSPS